jgi:hypothetical protein
MNLAPMFAQFPNVVSAVGTRITPQVLPKDSLLPAITWKVFSPRTWYTAGGIGMTRQRVQVTCWGDSYSDADILRRTLEPYLESFTGTVDGYNIQRTFPIGSYDFYEDEPEDTRACYDFYVMY